MRLWYLPNGAHLCFGLIGLGTDECGHTTLWLNLGVGVLVLGTRRTCSDDCEGCE